jgi:hypothetical protein
MREGDGVMKAALLILASVLPAMASVDGTVTNATTGKPQPGVVVMLVQPGQNGMQTLANAKTDAQGKFKVDKEIPAGPVLVQTVYGGATYNTMLPPGMPMNGVQIKVYEPTKDAAIGKPSQHMILIEPTGQNVQVSETFLFDNKSALTYTDPAKGSARFYLPKEAEGPAQVTVSAPGGMPVGREGQKTNQPNVFKIDYPVRPGETRFDVSYTLPAGSAFAGKAPDPEVTTFLVTPPSVTLSGDGLDSLGDEPQTHAHTYKLQGASFNLKIEGTGSLRNPETSASGQPQQQDDLGQPKIEVSAPRIYDRLEWVLALTFAILAIGGVMLYRKGTA